MGACCPHCNRVLLKDIEDGQPLTICSYCNKSTKENKMNQFKYYCPYCGRIVIIGINELPHNIQCDHCHGIFSVYAYNKIDAAPSANKKKKETTTKYEPIKRSVLAYPKWDEHKLTHKLDSMDQIPHSYVVVGLESENVEITLYELLERGYEIKERGTDGVLLLVIDSCEEEDFLEQLKGIGEIV